jgi:hypothetical protein
MAYTDIDKSDDYFNTVLYTGNGGTQSITGVNFQPDWVWLKQRANDVSNRNHMLFDSNRGTQKALSSNTTGAEDTSAAYLTSYDSDGFTLGSSSVLNRNTTTYASWNWLASNTTASNTDGSITSTVSANTTSGFSIVSYTGGGSFGDTVGHGLGAVPAMIIVKTTNATSSWYIWQKNMGATDNQFMDFSTGALQTSGATIFDVSAMSSTTFTLGTNTDVNGSGSPKIAYCFAEKKGFSKFGSYTGNGSADGTFVYTGFKPAFLMQKNTAAADSWEIRDVRRHLINDDTRKVLRADTSGAESVDSSTGIDILSNGFKPRYSGSSVNGSGVTYIYMAFAESPFTTSTGIPTTAR